MKLRDFEQQILGKYNLTVYLATINLQGNSLRYAISVLKVGDESLYEGSL